MPENGGKSCIYTINIPKWQGDNYYMHIVGEQTPTYLMY